MSGVIFQGKDQAWSALEPLAAEMRATWREMAMLALESCQCQSPLYIQVHRFPGLAKHEAVKQLRWRARQAGGDVHVSWPYVEQYVQGQPPTVRAYYWASNQRLQDLNCIASIQQHTALRLLMRLADRTDGSCMPQFMSWVAGKLNRSVFDLKTPNFRASKAAREDVFAV